MRFRYEAQDAAGNQATGSIEAATERDAARQLAAQGFTVYAMREQRAGAAGWRHRGKASNRELLLVLQEFATLLESGVTLVTALSSLAKSSHHPKLTGAFASMERSVRRGESFSTAFRASALPIPEYFHQLVQAGEATGRLPEALRSGVEQFDYDQRVTQEMKSALIYPAVLVCSGIAAVMIIFLWVVPRFGGLLTQHGDRMPALSRYTIGIGVWLSAHTWLVGLVLLAFVLLARWLWRQLGAAPGQALLGTLLVMMARQAPPPTPPAAGSEAAPPPPPSES